MDPINTQTSPVQNSPRKRYNPSFPKISRHQFYIAGAALIVILLLVGVFALRKSKQTAVADTNPDKVELMKPVATQDLNKEFSFPLKDASGKDVSKFKYAVASAEKRDEIIVKGKKAVAVKGRTFLILNLKITNSFNKTISINARDYIRLTVNKRSDKLAADIHNDPVEVQADSTKETRIGFPINVEDKDLTLLVGEIGGKKETITLDLK